MKLDTLYALYAGDGELMDVGKAEDVARRSASSVGEDIKVTALPKRAGMAWRIAHDGMAYAVNIGDGCKLEDRDRVIGDMVAFGMEPSEVMVELGISKRQFESAIIRLESGRYDG
jgi:hypothetical protein